MLLFYEVCAETHPKYKTWRDENRAVWSTSEFLVDCFLNLTTMKCASKSLGLRSTLVLWAHTKVDRQLKVRYSLRKAFLREGWVDHGGCGVV
jgi:hypothetical protein